MKLKALFVALLRKAIGGETFFVNHFTAPQGGSVASRRRSRQVQYRRMNGETLVLSTGAYLAHMGEVDLKLKFGGLKGMLAKEGAFFLAVSGAATSGSRATAASSTSTSTGATSSITVTFVGYEGTSPSASGAPVAGCSASPPPAKAWFASSRVRAGSGFRRAT